MAILLDNVVSGMTLIRLYTQSNPVMELTPIANSFPNGAPDHSRRAYISIETQQDVPEPLASYLKTLGWTVECEGQYWTYYD